MQLLDWIFQLIVTVCMEQVQELLHLITSVSVCVECFVLYQLDSSFLFFWPWQLDESVSEHLGWPGKPGRDRLMCVPYMHVCKCVSLQGDALQCELETGKAYECKASSRSPGACAQQVVWGAGAWQVAPHLSTRSGEKERQLVPWASRWTGFDTSSFTHTSTACEMHLSLF